MFAGVWHQVERPELVEIKAVNVGTGRDLRRLFDFSMRVSIKRPQAATSAASGASGAATAAKPGTPPKPGKVS